MNKKIYVFSFLLLVLLAFVILVVTRPFASPQSEELSFSRLIIEEVERQQRGLVQQQGHIPRQERVFDTLDSWLTFWSKYADPGLPQVDFSTTQVVAVFLGPAAPGHDLKINNIRYYSSTKRIVVHTVETFPDPKKIYPAVVVYPGDIVAFSSRPGTIEFLQTRPAENN